MKRFKLLMVAMLLFVGAAGFAQGKTAHINTQELVAAMPAMKNAQSQLQKLQKTYDTEISNLMKEFEAKYTQYEAEAESQTNEENAKRAEEIQGMQNNIASYRQTALKDLQQKEVDIFQPILDEARAAIQKVARAQGYEYVLDSSPGSTVILADGYDLLADVKKELGI